MGEVVEMGFLGGLALGFVIVALVDMPLWACFLVGLSCTAIGTACRLGTAVRDA